MAKTTVTMEIELRDVPGQLLKALQPLSDHGGNIRSIIHHRGKVTPRNTIPVNIVFEIAEARLAPLLAALKSEGFRVARLGRERFGVSATVLLIGHIVHTDLKETIHAVDSTGYAEVVDMSLSMPGVEERSSASLKISATGPRELGRALSALESVARKKGLLLVKPVGA
ncbi:MAG: ACT domain-containing protein [Halobacteria archaeon]